jgi:tRNA dimethylallyltransferase
MMQEPLILIGGPTASGKSALALRLAHERKGNIINADAMQVYKGLPLLTAQPSPLDKAHAPHLLYEVTDPAQASSAGKWLMQAREAIAQTRAEGRTPILVGGTGLYFEALLGGLADIPAIPGDVRATALKLYDELGEEKFRDALAERDPKAAARIARNDRQRLIRAYEVATHTGRTLSDWHTASSAAEELVSVERHLLLPPREELYAACDKRFLTMIQQGAIEEVKELLSRHLPETLPSMKILGVREIAAYLRGEATLADSVAKAQQMTRNYAKRQMTWFRNKWQETS